MNEPMRPVSARPHRLVRACRSAARWHSETNVFGLIAKKNNSSQAKAFQILAVLIQPQGKHPTVTVLGCRPRPRATSASPSLTADRNRRFVATARLDIAALPANSSDEAHAAPVSRRSISPRFCRSRPRQLPTDRYSADTQILKKTETKKASTWDAFLQMPGKPDRFSAAKQLVIWRRTRQNAA